MTIEEYARQVANRVRTAYNSKDRTEAFHVIQEAEINIEIMVANDADRTEFWQKVLDGFRSGRLLVEKQEGAALHQLMRDIERELADRRSKSADKK